MLDQKIRVVLIRHKMKATSTEDASREIQRLLALYLDDAMVTIKDLIKKPEGGEKGYIYQVANILRDFQADLLSNT